MFNLNFKKDRNVHRSEDQNKNNNQYNKDEDKENKPPETKPIIDNKKYENKIKVIKNEKKEEKKKKEEKDNINIDNNKNKNININKINAKKCGSEEKRRTDENNELNKKNNEKEELIESIKKREKKELTESIKRREKKESIIIIEEEDEEEKVKYFDTSKVTNVQIPKDYLNIIYYNLLAEEEKGIEPKADYTYMKRQKEINDKMRSILVDWIIDVHFKFGFTDETLFMTISIIDRYLSVNQITRSNFQLLGITALMIACKHEEIDLPKIDDFIYITDNAYVKNEVIKMENDVLSQLNFAFLYPSPIKFFEYLSFHFNFTKKHHMMGKYLMESFLLDVKNAKYKPSIISCACAYIVMKFFKMTNYHESYNKKLYNIGENMEKYTESNIKECAKDICLFVDNINKTNYQACVKKYSKPEQENVAIIIMNN